MAQKSTTISLQQIAIDRGGICLEQYTNIRAMVEWQCSSGHKWKARVANILYNESWCPHCKISRGENICRIYFETIFNKNFLKIRPKWLVNEKGNNLELDGYCKELGIAFEYNGEQHYSDNNPWKKDLLIRQRWDLLKQELCDINNVKLIIIPQLFTRLDVKSLKDFLKKEFIKNNIDIPGNYDQIIFDLSKMTDSQSFKEYKEVARSKNGRCLSDSYINCKTKLLWECQLGHIWEARPYTIKIGSWCPECAGCKKYTYQDVFKLIEDKNGKLLSKDYKNNSSKLEVECLVCNHIWRVNLNKIKLGRWCPKCGIKKRTGRPKGQ